MFLTFLKLYLKFCNYLILADRFTWNPSHFYQQNTKNLCLLKPCQVFLHMSYSSLLGSLRSTCKNYVCHFGFTSVGMCRLLCLQRNGNVNKNHTATAELKAKGGKPSTGITVLNVVDFFIKKRFYLIYYMCFATQQACTVKVFQF